ncbi:MAG: cation:proton antiporter [Candidatus Micrarchaeia archaeon]
MMNVNVLFVLIAGIVFLGYILTELFYKLKIAGVLPLMLIGVLLGPVLHAINTSSGSVVVTLVPYVTALAVAFILFDVGLRIRLSDLDLLYASRFTFALAAATGLVLGFAIAIATHMGILLSFAAGFGLAGPSAVVIPVILRSAKINNKLKTTLNFESVVVDSVTLIVPIILIEFIAVKGISLHAVLSMIEGFFIGSAILGTVFAFFWVFVLKTFKEHSKEYSWMLTISMVIATYGVAQAAGANGAMTVFVFGLVLANLPSMGKWLADYTKSIESVFAHVSRYQKEITFFVSTFFFVYIGLLFEISEQDYLLMAIAVGITALVYLLRRLFLPMIERLIQAKDKNSPERIASRYAVARGLSPVIVATLPLAFGVYAPPEFVGLLFLSVLFTNVLTTFGMYKFAKAVSSQSIAKPEVH